MGNSKYKISNTKYTRPLHKVNFLFVIYYLLFVICYLLLISCSSLVHKSGEALEGSGAGEKTIARYRPGAQGADTHIELRRLLLKNGEEEVEIKSDDWPNLAIRGGRIADDGRFELREARFLSSHVQGWNEFSLELTGNAVFHASGGVVGVLYIKGDVERIQISSGKIRLKSDRLTGTAALNPLRNRRERIIALVEWMQETSLADGKSFSGRKDFEKFWKPKLFPELVSKKKRPIEYTSANAGWNRADSIKWNTSYTEIIFPEELRELRDSGALLRDWEEALPWIYMEYSWNNIIDSLNGINLLRY